MDPLRHDLCRLTTRLERDGVRLWLAGGYGLLLKAEFVLRQGLETVAPTTFPRATQDLDLFLTANVVTSAESMAAVRDALRDLGYEPRAGGEFYQWSRRVDLGGREVTVKVDLLGQVPEDRTRISLQDRRMRPREFKGLHAHPVEEAALIDVDSLRVPACDDPTGPSVELPHPFNYLLLKLFAFEDRRDDESADFGRHHAFDLYRIVAMLTRPEWDRVQELRREYAGRGVVETGVRIVSDRFTGRDQIGALRLREHVRRHGIDLREYPVEQFFEDLAELLPPSAA